MSLDDYDDECEVCGDTNFEEDEDGELICENCGNHKS